MATLFPLFFIFCLVHVAPSSYVLPNTCSFLPDGLHWLKLFDGDEFPAVYQRCSNGYIVLDYSVDTNIASYFTSWSEWMRGTYGPTNDISLNWQDWFIPDTTQASYDFYASSPAAEASKSLGPDSKGFNYLISPDCTACEADSSRQIHGTQTAYWMTGSIYGCFWGTRAVQACDVDWDTDVCYTCLQSDGMSSKDGSAREAIGDDTTESQFIMTGVCPHTVQKSNHYVPQSHDSCMSNEGGNGLHVKPSLGSNGQYCVCVQPKDGYEAFYQVEAIPEDPDAPDAPEVVLDDSEGVGEMDNEDEEGINVNLDNLEVFELHQKDFGRGTFRIKKSGKYVIMEDIVFDYGRARTEGGYDYWPDAEDEAEYPGASQSRNAYFLGFFAGITVECDNVVLELNGHTLKMSDAFYYQQRWFTTIELSSQYFLPGEGIGNFGANPATPKNVIIRNGVLGLTSHHAIHGNYNERILIENMRIRDFETHGIQFNGFTDITLKWIEIGPTSTQSYVTGEYGHVRALLPRLKALLLELDDEDEIHFYGREEATSLTEITRELERQLDMAFDYVMHGTSYTSDSVPSPSDADMESFASAMKLFVNPSGIPLASAMYGIFLNTFGASVFTYSLYTSFYSTGAHLEDIYIHDMTHDMKEYVRSFRPQMGEVFVNPFNAPFDAEEMYSDLTDAEKGLHYKGNVFLDALVALNYFSDNWDYLGVQLLLNSFITPWALGTDTSVIAADTVAFGCNADVMLHSGKGINGLRLDGVQDVYVRNLRVEDLIDHTALGSDKCGPYSDGNEDGACEECGYTGYNGGHNRQTQPMQIGFSGNMVQAVNINTAVGVVLEDVSIKGVLSDTGPSFGVSVWPACDVTLRGKIEIEQLVSGREIAQGRFEYSDRPNKAPETCGVRVYWEYDNYTTSVTHDEADVTVRCVQGHVGCMGAELSEQDATIVGSVESMQCGAEESLQRMKNKNEKNEENDNKKFLFGQREESQGVVMSVSRRGMFYLLCGLCAAMTVGVIAVCLKCLQLGAFGHGRGKVKNANETTYLLHRSGQAEAESK